MKVRATFHAPDWDDNDTESCFTVTVRGISKEERDYLIRKIASNMARLQGLPGTNVTVVSIQEDD